LDLFGFCGEFLLSRDLPDVLCLGFAVWVLGEFLDRLDFNPPRCTSLTFGILSSDVESRVSSFMQLLNELSREMSVGLLVRFDLETDLCVDFLSRSS
jgi:hypothetical protein